MNAVKAESETVEDLLAAAETHMQMANKSGGKRLEANLRRLHPIEIVPYGLMQAT